MDYNCDAHDIVDDIHIVAVVDCMDYNNYAHVDDTVAFVSDELALFVDSRTVEGGGTH